ncbi:uncharacterized protein IL334_007116 [Kwoniella shivajii]|uniref:Alpha-1,6-mannosyltransferase n=1 Tax=Kwoniella shivajii TaxID=564305 RepID=A0ABZ1DBS3_9TREE|nr:hypothetical protein IL334_007116 [Kwoniella shivajii]
MINLISRNVVFRNIRITSPAKILLIFFILVVYFSFSFGTSHPPSFLSDPEAHAHLTDASLPELVELHDQVKSDILQYKKFSPSATAEKLRSPIYLPDGSVNFDPDLKAYVDRLRKFVDEYLRNTPEKIRRGAQNTLNDINKRTPPTSRPDTFPSKVWSTHPFGFDGVEEGFGLWRKLLPLPLSPRLVNEISTRKDIGWLKPVREGQEWEVIVTDDDGLDKWMSEWTAERITRGEMGPGKWSRLWGRLEKGVLRADLFRYVSMFAAGGIYSDSDTMPISHPYVWGLHAPSILHPDIETLTKLIQQTSSTTPSLPIKDRLNPRHSSDTNIYTQHNDTNETIINLQSYNPPYSSLSRRAPVSITELPTTILNPEISMIVAIEWDSMIGRTLSMWKQWTWFRYKRSWPDCCYPRGLEMVQNLLVSKPFHPIMLDTLATVAELVDTGVANRLSPLDLTGPGPFTDAVLRYLLVQYGVTAADLRSLRGPVRVGDVLILQEEAWHAPNKAIRRLLSHVQSFGGKVTDNTNGKDPWLFGLGWQNWQSGGKKVSYHGLTGIWKGNQ